MSLPLSPSKGLNRVRGLSWEAVLVALLILVLLVGSQLSDAFLTPINLSNLAANLIETALLALTMTLLIVAAEIDLSVASILGMASSLIGVLWSAGVAMPLCLLAALGAGALAGLLNGLLVTRLKLPSLAVTIGTLALYRGLAYALLGDRAVADFPPEYTNLGFGTVPGTEVPLTMLLFALLLGITAVVLHATPFGRGLYAVGSSETAARFSGLRVEQVKLTLFVVSGMMSALAGMVYTFRFSSARADNGAGLELGVIAAVLLGGVSIFGGRGSVLGAVAAVFLIGSVTGLLQLKDVSNEILTIVTGLLLIGSVLIPNLVSSLNAALEQRRIRRDEGGERL